MCAAILVALCTASAAGAAPPTGPAIAPKGQLASNPLVIKVSPDAILEENVRATAALYAASTLEEMKLFDVVDRLVDAFQSGAKPARVPPKLVRPLCFDERRALVPCALTR